MPPAIYTSPDLFDAEKEELLRANWIPVARLDQVPASGDYISLTILDQPILVVRGTDEKARVLSRVCLHRAAPIVEGEGNRKLFTCPYHAWSYDTTGQLVRAPLMDGAEDFDEKKCKLPEIDTEIWRGFLLINLDGKASPLGPQIESYADYVQEFPVEDVEIIETLDYEHEWNWKILVENFMEAYHHIAVHSTTFEPTYHAKDSFVPDSDGPYSILHMPSQENHQDQGGVPMFEGLRDWQRRDLLATVIFPFFLVAYQSNLVVWYQILPEAADKISLKIHICAHKSVKDLPNIGEIREGIRFAVDVIHQEDIKANDLVWIGLNAPMTGQGRLSPFEKSVWQLNQWWLEGMTDCSLWASPEIE